MKPCDIIIPVWNQLELTRACIESIARSTKYSYRLILIDNASDAETGDYLKDLAGRKESAVKLIHNEENLGFVKAVNQGIAASDAPYICIMNNDTIATEGWLDELADVMEANPDIGLLNPSSNTSGQFQAEGESIDDFARSLKSFKGQVQELYTCRGFCMLLRCEVIARLGLLDEVYHIGYFDDTDYCKKAQRTGFRTARAKASYVYHKENMSFKELADNKELFRKNERTFFSRWGRQVRVGYFLDNIRAPSRADEMATRIARSGHQIIIFLKKGSAWPVNLDHFDIRRQEIGPAFFGVTSLYKIFKRKNKKKLDVIVTDNRIFGRFLELIKFLHGSEVLINPDIAAVLETLKRESARY